MESLLKFAIAVLLMQQVMAIRIISSPPTVFCPLHETYNVCGTACPRTCDQLEPSFCTMQCVKGCFCDGGYVRNLADNKCCLPSECPASGTTTTTTTTTRTPTKSCPANQVYNSCGSACPLTCENYENPPKMCTKNCKIGCECVKGYVKKADGSCCLTSEC